MPHTIPDIESLLFLGEALEVKSAPGMDTMDAEFRAICDVAHKGDFVAAGEQIEPLLAEGVYDLRLVSIYFLARFVRVGLKMVSPILSGIESLTGANLEAFGPAPRREQHLDKRVAWTFSTLTDQVIYHRTKDDAQWKRWTRSVAAADLDDCVLKARALTPALDTSERAQAANALGTFIACLEETAGALGTQQLETPLSDATPEGSETPAPARDPSPGQVPPLSTTMQLKVSVAFLTLARKLEAFEQLVVGQRFDRAALVSADIAQELESFDPRRYLPDFFARYGRLFHRHVDQLAPHWGSEDTPQHHALRQLYQVDLAAFVEASED